MVARCLLALSLSLLVAACASPAPPATSVNLPPVDWSQPSNPEALRAAEQGQLARPTVAFFHAQWCPICQSARPELEALASEHADEVALVQMDIDDPAANRAIARYRVSATPTFVLLDADGTVLATMAGWPGREQMAQTIAQLLATSP